MSSEKHGIRVSIKPDAGISSDSCASIKFIAFVMQ